MPKGYRNSRIGLVFEESILCDYGCGGLAYYRFKNGKACCSEKVQKCSAKRKERTGEGGPFFGHRHTEETKRIQAKKSSGPNNFWYGKDTSKEKNNNWRGGPIEVFCNQCRKPKFVKQNVAKKQQRFFCDSKCEGKWRAQNGLKARCTGYWIKCAYCENLVWVVPSQFEQSKTKLFYCDSECWGKWLSVFQSGKSSPTYQGGKVEVECATCGKSKWYDPHYVLQNQSGNFYCSPECYYEVLPGREPWNKYLTKDDPRVAAVAEKIKETKASWTDEKREEFSRSISLSITKRLLEKGENIFTRGKSGHFFSIKNGKRLYYRSSYELVAYKILESLSKVESYDAAPFSIPYNHKGKNHYTIPDILVTYTDGTKELIEVKAEWLLQDEKTNTKLWAMNDYAATQGWNFNVWTEKELNLN